MKSKDSESTERYSLGTLERVLDILELLSHSPGRRLGEISNELGSNPTTILRTLRVLERNGILRRSGEDNGYRLGPRLIELGRAATSSMDIVHSLRSFAELIARDYNATVHIGMLRGAAITIVNKLDPPVPMVKYSFLGSRMPLHATSSGKAVLALVGEPLLEQIAQQPLERFTPNTIENFEGLRRDIERTAQRHFAQEREEYQLGFGCVGTAFEFDSEVYALSVSSTGAGASELSRRGARLADDIRNFLSTYLHSMTLL